MKPYFFYNNFDSLDDGPENHPGSTITTYTPTTPSSLKESSNYKHLSVVMIPEVPHSPELGLQQQYDSSKFKGIITSVPIVQKNLWFSYDITSSWVSTQLKSRESEFTKLMSIT